ncbi:hypothetical protein OROMI_009332 [Orobanche minor]
MKGVIRFGKKGKLQPRFIGPFEILDRVGDLAYRLALPLELSAVHNVFHVSVLRRYVHDPEHVCNYEELQVAGNLTYEEVPIAILERKIRKLRNKDVSLIKVQWSRHGMNEANWEREEEIRSKYPTFMFQVIISRTYGPRIVESSISSYPSSSSAFIQGQHSPPRIRASSSREALQTIVPHPLAHHFTNPEVHRLFLDHVRHRTIIPECGFTTHIELCDIKGADLKRAHDIIDNFANHGFCSLGVARQTVEEKTKESAGESWEFVGLLPLFDPPRHDSENIMESFKDEYQVSGSFSGISERVAPCSV